MSSHRFHSGHGLLLLLASSALLVTLTTAEDNNNEEEVEESAVEGKAKSDPSNGLGNHINWVTLKDGFEQAKEQNKPLMLIIHKSWCGACRSLKPKIAESKEMGELSKGFVMVNTMDEEEPPEAIYKPDGGYIPRILFFNPTGELLEDVINANGNPKYKYYYYDANSILSTMKKVDEMFGNASDNAVDENQSENEENSTKEKVEL